MPRLWRNLRWERMSARMGKSRKPLERYTIKGVYVLGGVDAMNDRLLENLARWMISHGTIISDRERSNYYTAVRIIILNWRGNEYTIVQVDGMTCRIDKN